MIHDRMVTHFNALFSRIEASNGNMDLIQVNPCDGCTACCQLPTIPKAKFEHLADTIPGSIKPFNTQCPNCDGTGCKSYAMRPSICEDFLCTYALGVLGSSPKHRGLLWSYDSDMVLTNKLRLVGQSIHPVSEAMTQEWFWREAFKGMSHPKVSGATVKDSVYSYALELGSDSIDYCRWRSKDDGTVEIDINSIDTLDLTPYAAVRDEAWLDYILNY